MDQGDNQMPLLPVDFDIDWLLLEDDWGFGLTTACFKNSLGAMQFNQALEVEVQQPWSLSPYEPGATLRPGPSFPHAYPSQESQSFAVDGNTRHEASIPQLQGTERYWMNTNLNSSIPLETSGLPIWALGSIDETGCVDASSFYIDSREQITSPSRESPTWLPACITPAGSRGRGNAMKPDVESETNFSNPENTKSRSEGISRRKKRLECLHPDCNLTFPRKYELERHRTSIHDCHVRIFCSVYGCNRIDKPFPRIDKFYEHVRKHHKGPERFLCILESCRQGPLTRTELVEHLNTQHSLATSKQPHLDDSLNTLNLGGQFRKGKPILLENINACPLRLLGCGYTHSPSSTARSQIKRHLREHDLLERSKGYDKIVAFHGAWVVTCPICRQPVCLKRFSLVSTIIGHVHLHTNEERSTHAVEIAQMFRPYLTGQEPIESWNSIDKILKWNLDPQFRARVEEAGVLSAITQTPEGSELQPGNAPGL